VEAALVCEAAGADGITVHLREDRATCRTRRRAPGARRRARSLNLEMAATDEMLAIALRLRPHQVTLVPSAARR
jgi:pyridoxine 5-phosphate synthase